MVHDVDNQHTDLLESLTSEHHCLFKRLYGVNYVKIKPHLQMHVPRQRKRFETTATCFPLERKHKTVQLIGKTSWSWQFEHCALRTFVREFFDDWISADLIEYELKNPRKEPGLRNLLSQMYQCEVALGTVHASSSMQTPLTHVHAGDLILLKSSAGPSVVKAASFARCVVLGRLVHVILGTAYQAVNKLQWRPMNTIECFRCEDLVAVLPWYTTTKGRSTAFAGTDLVLSLIHI